MGNNRSILFCLRSIYPTNYFDGVSIYLAYIAKYHIRQYYKIKCNGIKSFEVLHEQETYRSSWRE